MQAKKSLKCATSCSCATNCTTSKENVTWVSYLTVASCLLTFLVALFTLIVPYTWNRRALDTYAIFVFVVFNCAVMSCCDFGIMDSFIDGHIGFMRKILWRGVLLLFIGLWYFPYIYKFCDNVSSLCVLGSISFGVDLCGVLLIVIGGVKKSF